MLVVISLVHNQGRRTRRSFSFTHTLKQMANTHSTKVPLVSVYSWVARGIGWKECVPCTYGSYCPVSGSFEDTPCPIGTYRTEGFGSSLVSCHQCPPYKYCNQPGNRESAFDDCEAGYYCIFGSTSKTPSIEDENFDFKKAGPCPKGFYCEKGSPPVPCPRGTLGLQLKLTSKTGCIDCPKGDPNSDSPTSTSHRTVRISFQCIF